MNDGLSYKIVCYSHNTIVPADYQATHGFLLMQKKTLSSLSGYIKCNNASVPIAGMSTEKDEVNNFLNSGFYYE